MKEQKEEAEKHARMTEELQRLRVERALFKLFHIDFDAARHAEEIEEAEEALRARERARGEMSKEMEEKRQLKATRAKAGMMLERKIAKHRARRRRQVAPVPARSRRRRRLFARKEARAGAETAREARGGRGDERGGHRATRA